MEEPTITFKIVRSIEEFRVLWEQCSPHKTIFHDWILRFTYWKYSKDPLYCICGFIGNAFIGILPLQYSLSEKVYQFFGGYFMDDNCVFINPEQSNVPSSVLIQFYKNVPEPYHLTGISEQNKEMLHLFEYEDYKYYLSIPETYTDYTNYLDNYFSSKTKSRMKSKYAHVLNHPIHFVKGNLEDIDHLFLFNKQRFGNESAFCKPNREQVFRDLYHEYGTNVNLLTFYSGKTIVGVSLSIISGNQYCYYNTGIDYKSARNPSLFVTMTNIQQAIENKFRISTIDFFSVDCGWKEKWHLQKYPIYQYRHH